MPDSKRLHSRGDLLSRRESKSCCTRAQGGPAGAAHPFLACTAEELARLRQAYRRQGPERDIVAAYQEGAERFVDEPVEFPPRGGQHNQWYQCDKCEMALRTVDATHHQCPSAARSTRDRPMTT